MNTTDQMNWLDSLMNWQGATGNSGGVSMPGDNGNRVYPIPPYYALKNQYPNDQAYRNAINEFSEDNPTAKKIDLDKILGHLQAQRNRQSGPGVSWRNRVPDYTQFGMSAQAPNSLGMLQSLMSMVPQQQQQQRGPGYINPYIQSLMGG